MSDREKEDAAREFLGQPRYVTEPDAHRGTLTDVELEVVKAISHGLSDKMIGEVLGKSHYTVGKQVRSARAALNAKTRSHLVAVAFRAGLIE